MTDQNAPHPPQKAPNTEIKNRAMIIWGLNLASVLVGITGLVGVVLAYIWRGDATGTVYADHFAKQITTFWITLIAVLISIPLMIIGIGFLTLFAAVIYYLVISVLGLVRANEGRSYNTP